MDYRIISVRGHYDVYINDEFYCSADTYGDAAVEIEKYIKMREDALRDGTKIASV